MNFKSKTILILFLLFLSSPLYADGCGRMDEVSENTRVEFLLQGNTNEFGAYSIGAYNFCEYTGTYMSLRFSIIGISNQYGYNTIYWVIGKLPTSDSGFFFEFSWDALELSENAFKTLYYWFTDDHQFNAVDNQIQIGYQFRAGSSRLRFYYFYMSLSNDKFINGKYTGYGFSYLF